MTAETTGASRTAATDLACPPRYATPRNPDRPTLGHEVAAIAKRLGTPLMPWQRYVADVAMEYEPIADPVMRRRSALGIRLVHREVDLLVPRQSGKTTLILAMAVHRAMRFGKGRRQAIAYTAQTRNDAAKKWRDEHLETLWPTDEAKRRRAPFARYLLEPRTANGSEAIRWRNGSRHGITAVTEKSGHGPTLDLGFMDEAFAQVDDRLEQAMSPSTITRPDAQLWIVSTAGTAASAFLLGKVKTGRELPADSGIAYFEWSAPDDADPDDPATWWACMPALGYTTTESIIRSEREKMRDGFRRPYLNQWRLGAPVDPVIDLGKWAACDGGLSAAPSPDEPVVFALDVSPLRDSAAITAAGFDKDGKPVAELLEHGPAGQRIIDRLVSLAARHNPAAIVIDAKSPAAAMTEAARAAGLDVQLTGAEDMARACGSWSDLVHDEAMRHRGEPALTAAVEGARKRKLGDTWALSRGESTTDITPLVSHVLALYGLQKWGLSARRYDVLESAF